MIDLKDVVNFWITTNKNISRSWIMIQHPDDAWVLEPKWPKLYKVNARIVILNDCLKMHYDDELVTMDRGCHHEMVMAHDKEFFPKILKWMRFVRRR